MATRWPWPGATELDTARWVARGLREALDHVAPDLAAALTAEAVNHGATWLPADTAPEHREDEWIRATDVARTLHITAARVRTWGRRGDLPTIKHPGTGHRRYRLADARTALAALTVTHRDPTPD